MTLLQRNILRNFTHAVFDKRTNQSQYIQIQFNIRTVHKHVGFIEYVGSSYSFAICNRS